MPKRCCAQHCFNSAMYTKNISYFGFPRHRVFAEQWADLAGRSDLKEKSLISITKYYLCSEHFTANSFWDKDTKVRLKRDLPRSIALPSIFKNNLHEALQVANPKQSIEVHNIIIVEDDVRNKKQKQSPIHKNVKNEKTLDSCSQESSIDFENPTNQILFTDEEAFKYLEVDEFLQYPSIKQEQLQGPCYEGSPPLDQCRLCSTKLKSNERCIKLGESQHLQEFIRRVMSDKISVGDTFSQVVCKNCENNSLLCLLIIQQMDLTQEKNYIFH